MLSLEEAIAIARDNSKGSIIDEYMDSGESYFFPVETPGGTDGSTYYYEVNKTNGDHGICSDFWMRLFRDPEFGKAMNNIHKIEIG